MAFAFEQYGVMRQELEKGLAGTVYFWPKLPGSGNLDITSATYVIQEPNGTEIEASQSATLTTVGTVERVDCDVAAITTADEGYRCVISWVYGGVTRTEIVLFDVLVAPYANTIAVSLNDLQEERPDVSVVCSRLGELLNSKTAEQVAAMYAYRARVRINRIIKDRIDAERSEAGASVESWPLSKRYSRANAIVNREDLNRLERVIALMLIYAASTRDPDDGDDEMAALYRFYRAEMNEELKSLRIEYDTDGDAIADKTIQSGPRVMYIERGHA